jgi:hypothetical protein
MSDTPFRQNQGEQRFLCGTKISGEDDAYGTRS